jgi:hypothetical protein
MSDKWSKASLRLFSPVMSPDAICEALDIPASSAIRNTRAVLVESGLPADRPLDEHVTALIEKIERFAAALTKLRDRIDADVFCGFASVNGQGGLTLSAPLLARLGELGLDLTLDLYPPEAHDA